MDLLVEMERPNSEQKIFEELDSKQPFADIANKTAEFGVGDASNQDKFNQNELVVIETDEEATVDHGIANNVVNGVSEKMVASAPKKDINTNVSIEKNEAEEKDHDRMIIDKKHNIESDKIKQDLIENELNEKEETIRKEDEKTIQLIEARRVREANEKAKIEKEKKLKLEREVAKKEQKRLDKESRKSIAQMVEERNKKMEEEEKEKISKKEKEESEAKLFKEKKVAERLAKNEKTINEAVCLISLCSL